MRKLNQRGTPKPDSQPTASTRPGRLVVFDMDGVITSEVGYWNAARLAVGEILLSDRFFGGERLRLSAASLLSQWEPLFSREVVFTLSRLCVNTNWDRAYMALGLQLLARTRASSSALPNTAKTKKRLAELPSLATAFNSKSTRGGAPRTDGLLEAFLRQYPSLTGFELVAQLGQDLSVESGLPGDQFARTGPLWKLCHSVFQEWYCGSATPRKPGLLVGEKPLIPQDHLRALLKSLRSAGFSLGIATGRPEAELLPLLRRWRVLALFESDRIVTHDTVARAQRSLKRLGVGTPVAKPHPYSFAKALDPKLTARTAIGSIPKHDSNPEERPVIVSDTRGDILAAQQLSCVSIGIATTIGDRSTASVLKEAGADLVVASVGDLDAETIHALK